MKELLQHLANLDSKKPKQVLISSTTARADDCAVDSVIIQCVDIEAPSGIADHSIMAVRRCKAYDTVTPASKQLT